MIEKKQGVDDIMMDRIDIAQNKQLGQMFGVPPEEITDEFMTKLRQRRQEFYESLPEFKEIQEICTRADTFLSQIFEKTR